MKVQYLLALSALVAFSPVQAAINIVDPNYSTSVFFTHENLDAVQSYDWDSSNNLYYSTTTGSFNFGGLYKVGTGQVTAGSSDFASTSVVAVGNHVYYNTSDFTNQKVYSYGPLTGPGSNSLISTAPNYSLTAYGSNLLISGAPSPSFANHIYLATLDGSGGFSGTPIDLSGAGSGASGPLAFDASGNLYFAPGFSDPSIYKFSAAELSAAAADPLNNPLTLLGNNWLDYSALYASYSGGTSMAFDENGDLLLTLTNFVDPSLLVKFGVDGLGNYDNSASTILQDSGILGELRFHDGDLYVASGNQIVNVSAVPEPSTYVLVGLGLSALVIVARRRRVKSST